MAPHILFAMIAMTAFYLTILRPDAVPLTEDTLDPEQKNAILYTEQIIMAANLMEPSQLLASGNPELAIVKAQELAKEKSHDVVSILCAGNVLFDAGKTDEGLRLLKRSIALAPKNRYVRLNLADKLAHTKDLDECLRQYNVILKAYPNWIEPREQLAQVYFSAKRFDQAAEELQKAIENNPNDPELFKLQGTALARAGNTERGLEKYVIGVNMMQATGDLPSDAKLFVSNWKTKDRAIYELTQQIQAMPENYQPKLLLAKLYLFSGRNTDAANLLLEERRNAQISSHCNI
jgi:predicted Zn-dependent protease